ncbi:MAG: hypothetical protein DCC46_00945 [Armatimonadetes bacterium]|nr:MAG: hypothetical protein DCC46_00945 [Armatimonadota bacterium]
MNALLAQLGEPGGFEVFIDNLARTPLSKVVLFVGVCTVLRLAVFPYLTKTEPHRRGGAYRAARFFNEGLDALIYAAVVVFLLIRPFGIQAFRIPSGSMKDTLLENDFIIANKAVYRYTSPKSGDIVVFRPPAFACQPNQIDEDGEPKVDFIKRCIGVGGDLIEIRAGTLYRNGEPAQESYRRGENTFDFKLVQYDGAYEAWKGKFIPVINDFHGMPNYRSPIAKPFAVGLGAGANPNEPIGSDWKSPDELSEQERRLIDELESAPPARIPPGHYLMIGDNRQESFDGRFWGLVREQDIIGRSEFIWLPIKRIGKTR